MGSSNLVESRIGWNQPSRGKCACAVGYGGQASEVCLARFSGHDVLPILHFPSLRAFSACRSSPTCSRDPLVHFPLFPLFPPLSPHPHAPRTRRVIPSLYAAQPVLPSWPLACNFSGEEYHYPSDSPAHHSHKVSPEIPDSAARHMPFPQHSDPR